MTSEKTITKNIMDYLGQLEKCAFVKFHGGPFTRGGTPDILGSYRGRAFALEVKVARPGNKPTLLQQRELDRWQQSGAVARVVNSLQDAQAIMEGWDGLN